MPPSTKRPKRPQRAPRPKPRPLLDICNTTFHQLLHTLAETHAHPIDHALVAADPHSHTMLLAILLPDRFAALRATPTVDSNGVAYPVVAHVEAGELALTTDATEAWTALFTPDGRSLRHDAKVKDEVAFRRAELLEALAESRAREEKERRKVKKAKKKKNGNNERGTDRREDGVNQLTVALKASEGNGEDDDTEPADVQDGEMPESHVQQTRGKLPEDNVQENEDSDDDARARKRKKAKEKAKRQRARRKEEAERINEEAEKKKQVKQELEQQILKQGVTIEELCRGFKIIRVGKEAEDAKEEAKKLGLKVIQVKSVEVMKLELVKKAVT